MKPVAIALTLLLSAFASAQDAAPQRTLRTLVEEHRAAIAKASMSTDPGDYDKAFQAFIAALREFLTHDAKGSDRARARFELVHALMSTGKRTDAEQELRAFKVEGASAVDCAQAAYLATMFRQGDLAEQWIKAALAKPAPTRERMELGVLLMSRLSKPALATRLFEDALAAAQGDEAKAEVSWHWARATREREDIPETAYREALRKLAERHPKTRFGGIAADRLQALDFKVGAAPLPFSLTTLSGKTFGLDQQRGQVVLVTAWTTADPRGEAAIRGLQRLHERYADQGLVVVGIALDVKAATAKAAVQAWKCTFPQAHVNGGFESDLALRYRIEDTPFCFLVGRDGRLAGMNFAPHDEFGIRQLTEAVTRALAAGKAKDGR